MTKKIKFLYNCISDKKRKKPNWNQVSPENTSVKTVWRQQDRLKLYNGMLYREWIDVTGKKINKKQKTKENANVGTLNMYTFIIYLTKVNIK